MTLIQSKIKKISLLFCWLFQALFIGVPLVHIIAWFNAPVPIDLSGNFGFLVNVIPKHTEVLHPLSASTRLFGFLIDCIPMILIELIIYFLIRLFKLYQRAEIFSLQNVNYIKNIGYTLLLLQVVRPLCDGVLSGILTLNNPAGHRYIKVTITGTNLSMVLTAFIIILVSWIMVEGCRLREEQQLTV